MAGVGRTGTLFATRKLRKMAREGLLNNGNLYARVLDILVQGKISRNWEFVQWPGQALLVAQAAGFYINSLGVAGKTPETLDMVLKAVQENNVRAVVDLATFSEHSPEDSYQDDSALLDWSSVAMTRPVRDAVSELPQVDVEASLLPGSFPANKSPQSDDDSAYGSDTGEDPFALEASYSLSSIKSMKASRYDIEKLDERKIVLKNPETDLDHTVIIRRTAMNRVRRQQDDGRLMQ